MSKFIRIAAIFMLMCLCIPFFGCSKDSGTLLKLGEHTVSLNTYEFLLSRMKGVLYAYGGTNVSSSSYWSQIVNTDGKTADEFYREKILDEAYKYVEALYMFDEMGLTLPIGTEKEVDETINGFITAAGSENALNQQLSAFGYNADMLRNEYIDEVKINCVKEQLFGEDGSKIPTADREEYFNRNYVAFKQIFVATYGYKTVEDSNGDTVYYDENGRIAYDTDGGSPKKDEYGNYMLDENENIAYYLENGHIAYDKVNGVTKKQVDKAGGDVTYDYTGSDLAEAEAKARGLLESASVSTDEGFEDLWFEYSDVHGGVTYLTAIDGYYGSKSSQAAYLDEIASALSSAKVGECAMVKSSSGYHIVRKVALEAGAYDKTYDDDDDPFASFYTDLTEELFAKECGKYDERVEFDSEIYKKSLTMSQIGYNMYY